MAEEVLVKEALSSEMVSAGARLARHLGASSIAIDALMWLYIPESNAWRFIIGTPEVRTKGPKRVYQDIRSIIAKLPKDQQEVPFEDIFVIDSNDPMILPLRTALAMEQGISGTRLSQNVLNGTLIEDAYIYKLA